MIFEFFYPRVYGLCSISVLERSPRGRSCPRAFPKTQSASSGLGISETHSSVLDTAPDSIEPTAAFRLSLRGVCRVTPDPQDRPSPNTSPSNQALSPNACGEQTGQLCGRRWTRPSKITNAQIPVSGSLASTSLPSYILPGVCVQDFSLQPAL